MFYKKLILIAVLFSCLLNIFSSNALCLGMKNNWANDRNVSLLSPSLQSETELFKKTYHFSYAKQLHQETFSLLQNKQFNEAAVKYRALAQVLHSFSGKEEYSHTFDYIADILTAAQKTTQEFTSNNYNKKSPLLILGGTGFIGENLVETLLKMGYTNILITGNVRTTEDLSLIIRQAIDDRKVIFRKLDITDKNAVRKLFESFGGFKTVIQTAGQSSVPLSRKNPIETLKINTLGTLNIAEQCNHYGTRLIRISTTHVYGSNDTKITESVLPAPTKSFYEESMFIGDTIIQFLKTKSVILRSSNIFGPLQQPDRVVPTFIRKTLTDTVSIIKTEDELDFIYISDMVGAIIKALTSDKEGIYNIASGVPVSISALANSISNYAGSSQKALLQISATQEKRIANIDTARAKRELKWKPLISLDKGLQITITQFKLGQSKSDTIIETSI